MSKQCRFCGNLSEGDELFQYNCMDCGKYNIEPYAPNSEVSNEINSLFQNNEDIIKKNIHNIRGYLREKEVFTITKENLPNLISLRDLKPLEKLKKLLLFLYKKVSLGDGFYLTDRDKSVILKLTVSREIDINLVAVIWGKNTKEVHAVKELLVSAGYIEESNKLAGFNYYITSKGFEYVDSLLNTSSSDMGFVAMWFGQYNFYPMSDLDQHNEIKNYCLYLEGRNDSGHEYIFYKIKDLNGKTREDRIEEKDVDGCLISEIITAVNQKTLANIVYEQKRKLISILSKKGYAISMDDVWNESIYKAIYDAQYSPERIDMRDHNNVILEEIEGLIRQSKFIVADLTGHRGGVYFEAGFAKALQKPIIYTCEVSDFDQIHFDVRHFNCLKWSKDDLGDFRTRLQKRIEKILGKGNYFK